MKTYLLSEATIFLPQYEPKVTVARFLAPEGVGSEIGLLSTPRTRKDYYREQLAFIGVGDIDLSGG